MGSNSKLSSSLLSLEKNSVTEKQITINLQWLLIFTQGSLLIN